MSVLAVVVIPSTVASEASGARTIRLPPPLTQLVSAVTCADGTVIFETMTTS